MSLPSQSAGEGGLLNIGLPPAGLPPASLAALTRASVSATAARFSRFVQGRNPVVSVLDRAFGQVPDEEEAGGKGR